MICSCIIFDLATLRPCQFWGSLKRPKATCHFTAQDLKFIGAKDGQESFQSSVQLILGLDAIRLYLDSIPTTVHQVRQNNEVFCSFQDVQFETGYQAYLISQMPTRMKTWEEFQSQRDRVKADDNDVTWCNAVLQDLYLILPVAIVGLVHCTVVVVSKWDFAPTYTTTFRYPILRGPCW